MFSIFSGKKSNLKIKQETLRGIYKENAELLEMTAKISDAKAPVMLHVKEKKEPQREVTEEPEPLEDPLAMEHASAARTEIPPVVVAGLIIIILCIAGVLFFGPELRTKKAVSLKPPTVAVRAKAEAPVQPVQPPASSDEQSKEQAVHENNNQSATARKSASSLSPAMPSAPVEGKTSSSPDVAPSTSVASRHTGKAVYSVQLGVFRSEVNATALTKEFTGKGYNAFIVRSTDKDKGRLYRVLIGKSGDRKESAMLAAKVREKENIKVFIYAVKEPQP